MLSLHKLHRPLELKRSSSHWTLYKENEAQGDRAKTPIHFWSRAPSCFFFFLRAAPAAYESSQAPRSNWSYSCQPTPEPQQRQIQATSATDTTAHGNARSWPLSKARYWTRNLMVPSQICFYCATMGTPFFNGLYRSGLVNNFIK